MTRVEPSEEPLARGMKWASAKISCVKREELLEEIDREILKSHTREVILLFTDIVGSTRFYEQWGDIAGRQMVQAHNDLLFPIIAGHDGRII
jgi:class 3 adenylate cyclase